MWWHSVIYGQLEHDVLPERGNKNICLKQNTTTQIKTKPTIKNNSDIEDYTTTAFIKSILFMSPLEGIPHLIAIPQFRTNVDFPTVLINL